jgi:hypothetical protein
MKPMNWEGQEVTPTICPEELVQTKYNERVTPPTEKVDPSPMILPSSAPAHLLLPKLDSSLPFPTGLLTPPTSVSASSSVPTAALSTSSNTTASSNNHRLGRYRFPGQHRFSLPADPTITQRGPNGGVPRGKGWYKLKNPRRPRNGGGAVLCRAVPTEVEVPSGPVAAGLGNLIDRTRMEGSVPPQVAGVPAVTHAGYMSGDLAAPFGVPSPSAFYVAAVPAAVPAPVPSLVVENYSQYPPMTHGHTGQSDCIPVFLPIASEHWGMNF